MMHPVNLTNLNITKITTLLSILIFFVRAGVCHADELFLLFKANVIPFSKLSSGEKKVRTRNN